ncbi:unnamed protein product [Schistosoma curassoni]|nr:unnamed protein product [Schistosoma curassoni]
MNRYIQYIILWLISITFTLVISNESVPAVQKNCAHLNDSCSRIFFRHCCDKLVCHGFFNGICVQCLGTNKLCIWSSDCCSGSCWFFHCQEKYSNVTTDIVNTTETQQTETTS